MIPPYASYTAEPSIMASGSAVQEFLGLAATIALDLFPWLLLTVAVAVLVLTYTWAFSDGARRERAVAAAVRARQAGELPPW